MDEQLLELLAELRGSISELGNRIDSNSNRLNTAISSITGIENSMGSIRGDVADLKRRSSGSSGEGGSRRREPNIAVAPNIDFGNRGGGGGGQGSSIPEPLNVGGAEPSPIDVPAGQRTLGLPEGSKSFSDALKDLSLKTLREQFFNPEVFSQEIIDQLKQPRTPEVGRGQIEGIREIYENYSYLSEDLKGKFDEIVRGMPKPKSEREMRGRKKEIFSDVTTAEGFVEAQEKFAVEDQANQHVKDIIAALQGNTNAQGEASNKIAGSMEKTIASIGSALMLQQYAMMRFVQQPYQYETMPALQTIGNTGMMGGLIAEGLGAEEAVLQQYRQFGVQSAGAFGAAAGGFAGLAISGGRGIGGIIGAGVGGAAATFAGIGFQDQIADFAARGMDERARSAAIGRTILDPERFTSEFFRPTLQARLGYDLGPGNISEALNSATVDAQGNPTGVAALGYNNVVIGQLLGQALTTMAPDLVPRTEREREEFITTTGGLEAFGLSKDQIYGVYSDISRAGSDDLERSLSTLLTATSDEGNITEYTANVLVPALSKVVESRAVQNIAKSSEQVERETAALYSFFKNSDTNLGQMLEANPDVMSNIFNMVGQIGSNAVNDPALMLYLQGMGLSFSQIATGDPQTLLRPLEQFSSMVEYTDSGEVDLDSAQSVSSILGFLSATGIGVNTQSINIVKEMMQAINEGDVSDGFFEEKMEELQATTPEGVMSQLSERLDEIMGTEGGQATANLAEEANRFYGEMEKNAGSMLEIQEKINQLFSDSEVIQNAISDAKDRLEKEIDELLGVDSGSGVTVNSTDVYRGEAGARTQAVVGDEPSRTPSIYDGGSSSRLDAVRGAYSEPITPAGSGDSDVSSEESTVTVLNPRGGGGGGGRTREISAEQEEALEFFTRQDDVLLPIEAPEDYDSQVSGMIGRALLRQGIDFNEYGEGSYLEELLNEKERLLATGEDTYLVDRHLDVFQPGFSSLPREDVEKYQEHLGEFREITSELAMFARGDYTISEGLSAEEVSALEAAGGFLIPSQEDAQIQANHLASRLIELGYSEEDIKNLIPAQDDFYTFGNERVVPEYDRLRVSTGDYEELEEVQNEENQDSGWRKHFPFTASIVDFFRSPESEEGDSSENDDSIEDSIDMVSRAIDITNTEGELYGELYELAGFRGVSSYFDEQNSVVDLLNIAGIKTPVNDFSDEYLEETGIDDLRLLDIPRIMEDNPESITPENLALYRRQMGNNIRINAFEAMEGMSDEEKEAYIQETVIPTVQENLAFATEEEAYNYFNQTPRESEGSQEPSASPPEITEEGDTVYLTFELNNTSTDYVVSTVKGVLRDERLIS